jgi:hypothetical protein
MNRLLFDRASGAEAHVFARSHSSLLLRALELAPDRFVAGAGPQAGVNALELDSQRRL